MDSLLPRPRSRRHAQLGRIGCEIRWENELLSTLPQMCVFSPCPWPRTTGPGLAHRELLMGDSLLRSGTYVRDSIAVRRSSAMGQQQQQCHPGDRKKARKKSRTKGLLHHAALWKSHVARYRSEADLPLRGFEKRGAHMRSWVGLLEMLYCSCSSQPCSDSSPDPSHRPTCRVSSLRQPGARHQGREHDML